MDTAQSVMIAFTQFAVFASMGATIASAMMLDANLKSKVLCDFTENVCGPGLSLCRAGMLSAGALPNMNMGVLMFVFSVFVFMPFSFWSRVSQEAMVETKQYTLRRLLNLHWFVIPCFAVNMGLFLIQCFRLKTFTATRAEIEVFFIGQLVMMAYSLVVIFLHVKTTSPDRLVRRPLAALPKTGSNNSRDRLIIGSVAKFKRMSSEALLTIRRGSSTASLQSVKVIEMQQEGGRFRDASSEGGLQEEAPENDPGQGQEQQASTSRFWHTLNGGDAGVRFQGQVYLVILTYMMNMQFLMVSTPYLVVVSAIRLLLLLLVFCIKDVECTFDEMRNGNAGMGRLADAARLCKAMQAYLDGREIKFKVPLVKASLLRMQETLAVSYRWQGETADVGGLKINMSPWQMQMIIKAVKKSNCRCEYTLVLERCRDAVAALRPSYFRPGRAADNLTLPVPLLADLWIDCLAVEQAPTQLQSALLSR